MEQPLYRNQLDPNNPFRGDSGAFGQNRQEMRHAAGQIVLHETPHTGEITLAQQQEQPRAVHLPRAAVTGDEQLSASLPHEVHATQMSAWHNTDLAKEEYGRAFHNERAKEQLDSPLADNATDNTQPTPATAANQLYSQPQATPSDQPVADANQYYVAPPKTTPVNPLYNTMPNPAATTTTAQVVQPLEQNPAFVAPVTMTGALNPSQSPVMPMEPRLPVGTPAPVDAQHRLPQPRSMAKRLLQNPVVWLAIGIAMVIYFGSSLF